MKVIGIFFALSLVLVLPAFSLNALAAIYKWVDEEGVTHYSDTRNPALANQQKIDDVMPVIHSMEKPSARLTEIQRANADERRKRRERRAGNEHEETASRALRQCQSLEKQIQAVQARLRHGYREPRGNNLRERRRELQAQLNARCR